MKLSIVASPSRHGFAKSSAWGFYQEKVLSKIDHELINTDAPTPPTGDRVLLMGSRALSLFSTPGGDIFKLRGSLLRSFGKPATCTFDVQDAYDFKPDEEEKEDNGKDATATRRKNWFFWIEADTLKLLRPEPPKVEVPSFVIRPNLGDHIRRLSTLRDSVIYLDIECDMDSDTLTVVGFAVNDSPVFVVPVYQYNHKLAYDRATLLRFLATFSSALTRNRVVVHNSMFDLAYLATHYRLPFGRDIYDTMLAHKRFFSEIEKSLGHAISYWTWQPYHKDMGSQAKNFTQQETMYRYNANDVFAMRLVYLAQQRRLAADHAMAASVAQANSSVYPYLLASLKGFAIEKFKLAASQVKLQARIKLLLRIIRLLIDDPKFNPDSPKQIVKYFHDKLKYKVVERTDAGAPSLGGKAMYTLALKYPNPLIQLILYYREIQKEMVMSTFHEFEFPWNQTL